EALYRLSDSLNIIGSSRQLLTLLSKANRYAKNDRPVLITGESGVGKESLARFVHATSGRKNKEIFTINCATLTEDVIISRLFGHVKGAFTGAYRDREGIFKSADGGTLFLDEVGELSLEVQAMLLRVIQEGQYSRMGENKMWKTNVRIIAATNRDITEMVVDKKFRQDLMFRLNVLLIKVPPLRNRRSDLPLLVKYKLAELNREYGFARLMPDKQGMKVLREYRFPGNIRELFNIIERAYFSGEEDQLSFTPEMFLPVRNTIWDSNDLTLETMERKHILTVLEKCNGKVSGPGGAAKMLGLNRTTLLSRMDKLGLNP
ncbi:MAG: sigma 54-interacting transcriptional regulator, partial [Bacteroidota bacterium]